MRITYKRYFGFVALARQWVARHPEESKFKYALGRVLKASQPLQERYSQLLQDICIDNCATDEAGVILSDERGGFRYTKEGMKARDKATQGLDASEVEVEPYFATEVPELTEGELEYFTGIVVKEEGSASGGVTQSAAGAG